MRAFSTKDVLTTGDVARICHVAPRTVSKWFDRGQLRGYRIPGSRDRRIPLDQLLAFMRANGIPLTGLDGGACRVLIVSRQPHTDLLRAADASQELDIRLAANGFEAGVVAHQFRPHVVVLEVGSQEGDVVGICRNIKASTAFGAARVVAACPDCQGGGGPSGDGNCPRQQRLRSQGFDGCLPAPFTPGELKGLADRLEDDRHNDTGRSWRA